VVVAAQHRWQQLKDWTEAPSDPPVVTWLGGLFRPQSFITAVTQSAAQQVCSTGFCLFVSRLAFVPARPLFHAGSCPCLPQSRIELDQLTTVMEVIRKDPDEVLEHPREGAFLAGLYLEGARWNISAMRLEDAVPREMFCALPVIHCKALRVKVSS
jgi:dynein heavy chain